MNVTELVMTVGFFPQEVNAILHAAPAPAQEHASYSAQTVKRPCFSAPVSLPCIITYILCI